MNNAPPASQRSVLEGARILVAEDEAFIAMMVKDSLIEAGALVLGPVASVRDALRLVDLATSDGGISAAVLDIKLGNEKAARVADALREHGVPFLIATGYDSCPGLEHHRGVPVLCKPYDPQDLVEAVESLCCVQA
jgi:CheY-like chemotaxis protein